MKHVRPINPVITWHLLQEIPENAAFYASSSNKSTMPEDFKEDYWFLTPEDPGDLSFTFQFGNASQRNYKKPSEFGNAQSSRQPSVAKAISRKI